MNSVRGFWMFVQIIEKLTVGSHLKKYLTAHDFLHKT